ncbi:MAG TPA: hypothetical protein PKD78_06200 [Saprospiraceae bacterium]|nr:hypothetical protein [Saprospiraceae bacterium]HNG90144.1 hypothetical protein [Saprospiraceae bacterium]
MKILFALLLTLAAWPALRAQDIQFSSGDPAKMARIAATRQQLDTAFLYDDPAYAALWMDSLTRMEDEQQVALVWDERWLLYFWSGAISNALDEATRYDAQERMRQSWKNQPPDDSLFEHLDRVLLERQYQLFADIRNAFLNEEEKAFATLLLEYLLRLNGDKPTWATKIDNFLAKYPQSRFGNYLRSVKPYIPKPGKDALGAFAAFRHGAWQGEMERNLKPLNAIEFGLYYWRKRMNYLINVKVGGSRLSRNIDEQGYLWPKKDLYNFVMFELQVGYDIADRAKFRIFPTVGGGISLLRPPEPDETEAPLPDYYELFRYSSPHLNVALNVDIKAHVWSNNAVYPMPTGSYHGPRFRVGYQWMRFDRDNPALQGQQFFLSIGYMIHGRLEATK